MVQDGYIYWIFSEVKKPYFVGSNGLVQEGDKDTLLRPDGQPAKLQYAPDGWKDTLVNWGRNPVYLGLFRDFTVPMRFVKDGATILRHILWTRGKNAVAYLGISKVNRLSYPTGYDAWFLGELDFSKFKQNQEDDSFTLNVMQGGLSKLLKANENTVYDIPINTDPDRVQLYLDGMPFTNKIIYTVYNGQVVVGTPSPQFYWLGMGIVAKTGISQGVIVQDVPFQDTVAYPNDFYFLWSVSKTISVRVVGIISGICTHDNGGANSVLTLRIVRASDTTNTVYQTIAIPTGGPYSEGDPFSVAFDETIAVNPHERLYFRISSGPWTQPLFTVQAGEIGVTYDVRFAESYAECLTPFTLFERLVEKMTEGKYGVSSGFLLSLDEEGTLNDNILLTSGTALRTFRGASSIKTSYADFFQAMKTRARNRNSVGTGIENDKLVMEQLDHFFQTDVITDLGIVDKLVVLLAEDLGFNTIKSGYKDQTVDDLNGRNEVNVTQLWSTPNNRTQKELNLVSPYRADPYGIESTRSDQFGQARTSSTADNETFVISVDKQQIYDFLYHTGAFELQNSGGSYYIQIPVILQQITNGLKIIIDGSVSNDGIYTIENTSYIMAGFTIIRVTEALTNESVSNGTLYYRDLRNYNLKRPAYTSITGVDHPAEIFNVELSPKRSLLNCGGLMHPFFDKEDIKSLKLESAIRNIELSTTIGGVTVTEKEPVVIGTLQDKLFQEYYMTFTTRVPIDYLELMAVNPYGKIKFTDSRTGLILYGYMWDGGIKPEPKDKQEWKLIAAPNQDLSRFI